MDGVAELIKRHDRQLEKYVARLTSPEILFDRDNLAMVCDEIGTFVCDSVRVFRAKRQELRDLGVFSLASYEYLEKKEEAYAHTYSVLAAQQDSRSLPSKLPRVS